MKMKKLIAVGAAAAMSMAMCVNVFAESEVKNADKASYATGAATYSETITAKDGTQMTVVVFKKVDDTETVSNANIEYINQDTANASLYAGMKTKNDLLAVGKDGSATYAGDYIIRVGYYDAEGTWRLAQGSFTVGTKTAPETITVKWGDVNDDDSVNVNDSGAVLNALIGGTKTYGDYTIGQVFASNIKWGDVNNDGSVNVNDSGAVLNALIGGTKTYGDYTIDKNATIKK